MKSSEKGQTPREFCGQSEQETLSLAQKLRNQGFAYVPGKEPHVMPEDVEDALALAADLELENAALKREAYTWWEALQSEIAARPQEREHEPPAPLPEIPEPPHFVSTEDHGTGCVYQRDYDAIRAVAVQLRERLTNINVIARAGRINAHANYPNLEGDFSSIEQISAPVQEAETVRTAAGIGGCGLPLSSRVESAATVKSDPGTTPAQVADPVVAGLVKRCREAAKQRWSQPRQSIEWEAADALERLEQENLRVKHEMQKQFDLWVTARNECSRQQQRADSSEKREKERSEERRERFREMVKRAESAEAELARYQNAKMPELDGRYGTLPDYVDELRAFIDKQAVELDKALSEVRSWTKTAQKAMPILTAEHARGERLRELHVDMCERIIRYSEEGNRLSLNDAISDAKQFKRECENGDE